MSNTPRRHRARPNLKPRTEPAAEPVVKQTGAPLQQYIQAVPGPDGRAWPSVQLQQGQLALAFSIPAEDVETFLEGFCRDLRRMAAECMARNGTKVDRSGLLIAGANDVPRFPHR